MSAARWTPPRFLYHGTSESAARRAVAEGLRPRGADRPGNWGGEVESNPECVYLTDVYGPYFASHAASGDERWAVLEIDRRRIDRGLLRPDEDCMEQGRRGLDPEPLRSLPMVARTRHYRERMDAFAYFWPNSLRALGTCGYRGTVPPGAIARVALYDPRAGSPVATGAIDPTITLMNHALCARKYSALTRWFLGDPANVEEFLMFDTLAPEHRALLAEQITVAAAALANRRGLEVLARPRAGWLVAVWPEPAVA